MPRGPPSLSTKGAEKQVDPIKRAQEARQIRGLGHAKEVAGDLGKLTVTVQAAKASGRLGSALRLGHRGRRRRRRPRRGRTHARQAGRRGVESDQDDRHPPGHGSAAPRGHRHHRPRGRRGLTKARVTPNGRAPGSTSPGAAVSSPRKSGAPPHRPSKLDSPSWPPRTAADTVLTRPGYPSRPGRPGTPPAS